MSEDMFLRAVQFGSWMPLLWGPFGPRLNLCSATSSVNFDNLMCLSRGVLIRGKGLVRGGGVNWQPPLEQCAASCHHLLVGISQSPGAGRELVCYLWVLNLSAPGMGSNDRLGHRQDDLSADHPPIG